MADSSVPNDADSGGLLALLNSLGNGGQPPSIDPKTGLPIAAAAPPNSGLANIGLQLLASNTPSPVRQSLGALLGKSVLSAQDQAFQQAQQRQAMTANSINMQRQALMMPLLTQALKDYNNANGDDSSGSSQGAPQSTDPSQTSADPSGADAWNAPSAAPAATPGSADPSGVDAWNAPSGASSPSTAAVAPGAAPDPSAAPASNTTTTNGISPAVLLRLKAMAASSAAPPGAQTPAAPPGAPTGQRQMMPPGGSGQLPPGLNPFRQLNAATALSLAGMPGASTLVDAAKTRLQYNQPLATAMKAATDQVTVDQQEIAAAQSRGDTTTAAYLTQKLKQDTGALQVARNSGIRQEWNPKTGTWSMYNPELGIGDSGNGVINTLPGMTNARRALAAAQGGGEEAGRLAAETAPVGGTGTPAPSPGGKAPPSVTAPQLAVPSDKQGQAAIDADGFIPPVLTIPGQQPIRPGNTGAAALAAFQTKQADSASALADTLQEKASDAQTLLTQAQQIQNAAREFTPGKYANVKGEFMAAMQGLPGGDDMLNQIFGPNWASKLGSYQEGQKLSIQLQALATKQLGPKEAQQVFATMGKSIPNLTLSADGLTKISAYLTGIARYNMASAAFGQRLQSTQDVASLNSLPQTLQAHTNPVFYMLASAPPDVRQEMVSAFPPAQKAQLGAQWNKAIQLGLAPKPQDYEGE